MFRILRCCLFDESGATLAEYALIVMVLGIAILAGAGSIGSIVKLAFGTIGSAVSNA